MNRRDAMGGGIAGLLLLSGRQVRGQEQDGKTRTDFGGKYLVVFQKSQTNIASYLGSAHIETLGDKNFLVGTGITTDDPHFKGYGGLINMIALDDVSLIQVFPSLERLKDHLSRNARE